MRATAGATIAGAESEHEDSAGNGAIERTLTPVRAKHFDESHPRSTEQVINVPAQGFLPAGVASNPGLQPTLCGARIDVVARQKLYFAQPADRAAQGLRHLNEELIADLTGIAAQ